MCREIADAILGRPRNIAKKNVVSIRTRKCERVVKCSNQLTFFSASTHLLIAEVEDPVRSLRARTASLMTARVAIVGIGDGAFCFFGFYK